MKRYMSGLGKDPKEGARLLKKMGFSGVVGSVGTVDETLRNGMESYLCSDAYRGPDFTDEEWLSEDIKGRKIVWFYSTCPTRQEVRDYNLENIRRMASTPGIKGILIDGARFASPASGTGEDPTASFFTCFCDHCMQKAKSMGFDPEKMKRSVNTLKRITEGEEKLSLLTLTSILPGLGDWLHFRRAATTEHLKAFCDTVHRVNAELEAGIYIFAPALCRLVGQSYSDLKEDMDLFAPMLYRRYPDRNGACCLNSEVSRILDLTEKIAGMKQETIRRKLSDFLKLPVDPRLTAEELFRKGYDPSVLKDETQRARKLIGGTNLHNTRMIGSTTPIGNTTRSGSTRPIGNTTRSGSTRRISNTTRSGSTRRISNAKLIPIIQLDDPKLEEASTLTMQGGADAVNYFTFNREQIEQNEAFFTRER